MTGVRIRIAPSIAAHRRRRSGPLALVAGLALGLVAAGAQAADPAKGGALYQAHCAICHGQNGQPVWPGAPDFRRPGALLKTDGQLITLLRQGRGVMPSYLGVIKDREMYDLLAHLRTLN